MQEDDFSSIHPDRVRKIELRQKGSKGSDYSQLVDELTVEAFQGKIVTYLEFNKNSPLLKPKSDLNKTSMFEDE